MSQIDLEAIKALRARSGAGIGACKEALTVAEGNVEQAMLVLKELARKKLEKKSSRPTPEVLWKVGIAENLSQLVAIEVACETDFVKNSELFQSQNQKLVAPAFLESTAWPRLESALVENQLDLVQRVDEHIRYGHALHMEAPFLSYQQAGPGEPMVLLAFESEAREALQAIPNLEAELAQQWKQTTEALPGFFYTSKPQAVRLWMRGRPIAASSEAWEKQRQICWQACPSAPPSLEKLWVGIAIFYSSYPASGAAQANFAEEVRQLLVRYQQP